MTTQELDKMTPEEKRKAIAEICGLKYVCVTRLSGVARWWAARGTDQHKTECVPDYLNSLDAMHEAVSILPTHDKSYSSNLADYPSVVFGAKLAEIVGVRYKEIITNDGLSTLVEASPFETFKILNASADQLACAFLLTMLP